MVIAYPVSRIFLPEGPNYDGSNTTSLSYVAYLLEDASIGFGALTYLIYYFNARKINVLAAIWLSFFTFAMFHSAFSSSIITSFHFSIRGIAYALLGLLFCEYLRRGQDQFDRFKGLQLLIVGVLLISLVVETASTISFDYVKVFGVGGSYVSLLLFLLMLYSVFEILDGDEKTKYFKCASIVIGMIYLSFFLNSFSSFVCFFSALMVALIVGRYYKISLLILSLASILAFWLYGLLSGGKILIAHKNLETLLSGSGRFEVWTYCIEKILHGELSFLGYGFMADRFFLLDASYLSVTHTCHNSFLTTLVGLGYLGGVFYVIFILFHVYWYFNLKGTRKFKLFSRTAILSMVLFGIGSPLYPGSSTVLIPFSIVLFGLSSQRSVLKI